MDTRPQFHSRSQSFQAGSLPDLNRLVLECQDEAYTLAYRLLGDERLAAEALQAAVDAAGKNSHQKIQLPFRLWIFSLLVQACVEKFSHRLQPNNAKSQSTDIQPLLNRLPLDLRIAVVLVDVLGLSYQESSRVLRLSTTSIQRNLALGRMEVLRASS